MSVSKHPLYFTWYSIRYRIIKPHYRGRKHYGGRGLELHPAWNDFNVWLAYVEKHLGPRPEGYSLDRKDNNVGYVPGNIRWATVAEQNRNRSITRMFTHEGETLCLKDWATRLGIPYGRLKWRIRQGEPFDKAIRPESSREKTLTYQGETKCIRAWARQLGISRYVIQDRLKKGWPVETVLSPPPKR